MVQDPPERSQWMSCAPCPYPTAFILFVYLGERWCAPSVGMYVVMVDDSIYEDLSPVGNLKTSARVGLGIIICYVRLMTRPPLWGGVQ